MCKYCFIRNYGLYGKRCSLNNGTPLLAGPVWCSIACNKCFEYSHTHIPLNDVAVQQAETGYTSSSCMHSRLSVSSTKLPVILPAPGSGMLLLLLPLIPSCLWLCATSTCVCEIKQSFWENMNLLFLGSYVWYYYRSASNAHIFRLAWLFLTFNMRRSHFFVRVFL